FNFYNLTDSYMERLFSLTLILILSAGLIISCKKDKGEPPVLPAQESMIIDFSNFATQKKSADLLSDQKGTENSNWDFAATVAGVWNLIINTTLAVPVTSFKLAVDQDPVFLSEKTWQWSYNFSVASVAYKARLTGQIRTSDVLWKMYITKEGTGGFAEFVWFEGTSKSDGTGGQWILNQNSQSPGAMLQIDWTKTGTSIGSVKYTYVKNLDSFKTSYIEYGLTTSTLNAYYTIYYYTGLKFSDVNVEWNTTTHNGRVKCLEYLSDNKWYCWNEQKINITCLQ
ncbi:MAG: hypothetical protein WCG82_10245, partial [Bacteroidota bacterium]